MARKKNTTFVGCEASAVDIDAPTYKSTLENAVGDTAKIYDMVTGSNAEATTIRNRGESGRGAHLGMPLVMQAMNADISWTGMSNGAGDGNGGETLIFLAPVYLTSVNDRTYRVIVKADLGTDSPSNTNRLFAVIYDDVMGELAEVEMTLEIFGGGLRQWYCNIDPGAQAGECFFGVKIAGPTTRDGLIHPNGGMYLHSVSVKPHRPGDGSESVTRSVDNFIRVDTPSSSQAFVFTDIDTNHFADLKPFDAYALSRVNQNQNALFEYLTGWPAGGDEDYTLFNATSGNVNSENAIAKHRFKQFARTMFASEGLPRMQLATWALGAIKTNGELVVDKPYLPGDGMMGWYGVYPRGNGAKTNFVFFRQSIMLPGFESSSNTFYKIKVIAHSEPGATGWTLNASLDGSAWGTPVSFAQLGSTDFWAATVPMPSGATKDGASELFLRATKSSAPALPTDELILLGVGLAYVST